ALTQVLDTIQRVAPTNAPVLILGESGTGKELIAEAIHRQSRRASESFVKVNLGGVSQSLFESEMFGYRKGAFTGAVTDRAGRFELADKGTIFLDEIGDLDLASQVKLLRVLQDQTFEPLGDSHTRQVNVRVVCATNADLPRLIEEGRFREDLYYRINLITVHLPPLRERKEDIPALAAYFINKQCEANALPPVTLSDDAVKRLKSFSYPGNIRQLKNIVERAVLMSGKSVITAEDIELPTDTPHSPLLTPHSTLEEQERTAIENAMREYDGNLSKVAEALGLSRGALYRRLEKYNLRN
ncbi:MAG: sigma-54 dependent transcriptional regulator, partial [Prevotella sp.]|nr:sigma-54 dependent transcriptional regulator [Prevotella sp.]